MTPEVAGSSPASRVCAPSNGTSPRNDGDVRGSAEPTTRVERLYAITRADLSVGMRAAQVGHVLIDWVLKHGRPCDSLVVLQVKNEPELKRVLLSLRGRSEAFFEPDLGNQLTAIAAGPECWREVSSIGLLR